MFDTHESVAVRHTGQLIKEKMGSFLEAIDETLQDLPDEEKNTPWFQLLSKDVSLWEQSELDTCYQYILENHWKEKNIKPPVKIVYEYGHQDPEVLEWWCNLDDRHLSFEAAKLWIETDECNELLREYINNLGGLVPVEDDDPFNPEKEHSKYAYEYASFEDDELNDFDESWSFINEQIRYVDTTAPEITAPLKLQWLRIALVSQPVTELFRKKKAYEAGIRREKELREEVHHV